jgi:hypothetical protein
MDNISNIEVQGEHCKDVLIVRDEVPSAEEQTRKLLDML